MRRPDRSLLVTLATGVSLGLAFWPVWVWYAGRMTDGSDERAGLLSLATAVVVTLAARRRDARAGDRREEQPPVPSALIFCVGIYALVGPFVPALVRALFAVAALALFLSRTVLGRTFDAPLLGLLTLGLPIEASLQYFLGYPLRLVATHSSALLLKACGLRVGVEGLGLTYGGETVLIDAPCSGVHMLWTGLFLAFTLAALYGLGPWRTAIQSTFAGLVVILANILRATALFVKEAGLVSLPAWTHSGIGLALFALAALVLVTSARRLQENPPDAPTATVAGATGRPPLRAFVLVCLLAAVLPAVVPHPSLEAERAAFPGWPENLDGLPLRAATLTERDARFARAFPGRVGAFTSGQRRVLLRWVGRATRQLHSAADCYRGAGYQTRRLPVRVDVRGRRWSCFAAIRPSTREVPSPGSLIVCERIEGADGSQFTDPSAWYWQALLDRSRGPWLAITIAITPPPEVQQRRAAGRIAGGPQAPR